MSFDLETLFVLLPSLYRLRDADSAERLRQSLAGDDEAAEQFVGLLTTGEEAERQRLLASRQSLLLSGLPVPVKDAKRLQELEDKRGRGPLKALLAVVAEQIAVLEEDLEQLYDDQFIETCAEWVVPYIGDLVGTRGLFYFPGAKKLSGRAQVANTLAYRRRKGTASIVEQLARDVTEWDANVVEYFQLLATTQYLNHLRPENISLTSVRHRHFAGLQERLPAEVLSDLSERQWKAIEYATTPFDTPARTVDVRNIKSRRGKYNIPNVGIHLWRVGSYSVTDAPAYRLPDMGDADVDGRRYLFNAAGLDTQLYNRPETEDEITHLAEPVNVPMPLSRSVLDRYLTVFYGADSSRQKNKSILINRDGTDLVAGISSPPASPPSGVIRVCDLSDKKDVGGNVIGWYHHSQNSVAIDPVLGRIAFPLNQLPPQSVRVNYHHGFSAEMGGGEYGRGATFSDLETVFRVAKDEPSITPFKTIQEALDELAARMAADSELEGGVVEIIDSDYYAEPLNINVPTGKRIELRAADERRPVLLIPDGGANLSGGENGELTINGLLVASGTLHVSATTENRLRVLRLSHTTLVPGLSPEFQTEGILARDAAPKIVVSAPNVNIKIDHSIVGALRVADTSRARITNSIVDAGAETNVAYAALDDASGGGTLNDAFAGGALETENTTIIGRMHAIKIELASNTIFLASFKAGESWPVSVGAKNAPVVADRVQEGCVRFSYVPPGSQVPRLFRCQPQDVENVARVRPVFNSVRYGDADYSQLSTHCAIEIKEGADDGAEMGAFHDLYQPQRVANLRARLDEYLRFGLEAGIFFAS